MSALEEILPDIRRAATRVARDWAAVTTADDLEQEIVIRLLDADYADRLSRFEPGARAATLAKIGTQVANQERIDFDHFTGNFRYSTHDVRKVLDQDALIKIRERTVTEELDLDEGLAMLRARNARYADTVELKFRFKEAVDRRVLHRAIDALTECMNTVHKGRKLSYTEGPGTRRVISNAAAQVQTAITETGRVGEGRN